MLDPLGGILCLVRGLFKDIGNKNIFSAPSTLTKNHPEPHRDPNDGKIIIENSRLYYEDAQNYGASQAMQWAREGKYNLSKEELEKEQKRIDKEYKKLYELAKRCK